MNRKLVLMLTLTLLVGMLNVAFNVQRAKASGTIYIRADGSIDPPTAPIYTADNITYTLTGNITADADGIVIERNNIVLNGAGYTVAGSGSGNGTTLTDRSNVTVRNTAIKNFHSGIYLGSSCNNNVLSGNNVTANVWAGIWLSYSSNNTLSGNNVTDATANNGYGIYLGYSSDNTLSGNNVTANNYCGIMLVSSSNDVLSGNNVTANNLYGIVLSSSSDNNVLSGNNVTANNFHGIELDSSSDNVLSGNNVTTNDSCGIYLFYGSSNNTLSGNNITANSYAGIYLGSSSNNSIAENNITANSWYGILLVEYNSNYNSISGNNIKDGDNGISVYGSSNNTVHHNKFMNNTRQVYSDGSPNAWDNGYPSGGNYWSDYVGNDTYSGPYQNETGRDGIGDTPYIIDENNRDRYPMIPEHELAVSITAPIYLQIGSPSSLDAIVTNDGFNDEANVNLILFINGTTADSTTIPLLQAGNSYKLSYVWTPTVEGTYNVTAYAHPVPSETSVENNQKTAFVTVVVSVPFGMQVGVKAGDWIKCTYTISGWPSGTPYPEWLKVEFLSVEGTNATVRVTMHMSDGTEQNATVPVDVVTGGGAFQGLSGFVIPANCTTGDSIYMSGYGNVTIAGETTRSYAGATRTIVTASLSQYGTQLTYYWDKQTGVIVEASTTSGTMTGTAKATETNMWQAGPSGLPIEPIYLYILVVLAIIIVVGAAVFIKRRKKKPPEEVESPQT